jgi:hypothetical protein
VDQGARDGEIVGEIVNRFKVGDLILVSLFECRSALRCGVLLGVSNYLDSDFFDLLEIGPKGRIFYVPLAQIDVKYLLEII